VDERYDPETSTVAAAHYLRHLYSLFGSWPLAIAAYNGGEGLVDRALKRQNTRDFWSLRLPRQTEEYVPQFMAALHLAKDPGKYGLFPEAQSSIPFEEVLVYGSIDLRKISDVCDAPNDMVKLLNPSLKRSKTPPRNGGMKVRVPAGSAEKYISSLSEDGIRCERLGIASEAASTADATGPTREEFSSSQMPDSSAPSRKNPPAAEEELYLTYRVRKGDTLYRISRSFGVSLSEIQEFNDLNSRNVIKPGQRLLIPRDQVRLADKPSDNRVRKSAKLVHVVRRGENLLGISRSYGVSVEDLMRWNSLSRREVIRSGQRLVIFPDEEPGSLN